MTKREQVKGTARIESTKKDLVNTPPEVIAPLLPSAAAITEPCAGSGALCSHLSVRGFLILEAYDIGLVAV